MPNYQDGKIYMIESISNNCRYYGSTVDTLSRRLAKHRSCIKAGKPLSSKEVLKYQDARILLVELYPCNSKMELEAKEAEYIRNNDCVNKCIPQRTLKQYREDNKEILATKNKQYRQDNKDVIKQYRENNKEYMKQYYQDNKEVIKQYQQDNKERIKQYQQDNKEHLQQYKKQYRQDNKEVIKEKSKQYQKQYRQDNKEQINKKCLCDCGKICSHNNYKRHTQSKQHQFYQKTYDFIIS